MNTQPPQLPVTLYKLGGSLLDWEQLASHLSLFLEQESKITRPLLIVGGGPAGDLVRTWDDIHHLGEEAAHHLAIHSLTLTEKLITLTLPKAECVANKKELQAAWLNKKIPILITQKWITHQPIKNLDALPLNWSVTTDSIAVRIAVQLNIESIVFLKSFDLPQGTTLETAMESGWVDPHFPTIVKNVRASRHLELYWKNLRTNCRKRLVFNEFSY